METYNVAAIAEGAGNLMVAASQARSIPVVRETGAHIAAETVESITAQLRPRNIHLSVSDATVGAQIEDALVRPIGTLILKTLERIKEALKNGKFPVRLHAKLSRLEELISKDKFNGAVVAAMFDEAAFDLMDELESPIFLRIDSDRRQYFEKSELGFGQPVVDAFPDAARDVAAACRCYALDEWTATVFHCMRVLEHGLKWMAGRFNVPFETDSWHKVIRAIEDEIHVLRNKNGLTQMDRDDITFYSDAAAQFRYFKDAWRNHVSHAREHYDEREAIKVLSHVGEFMQHLSDRA
jgi:hypothetical protein